MPPGPHPVLGQPPRQHGRSLDRRLPVKPSVAVRQIIRIETFFWAPNWQIFDSSSVNEAPLDGLTSLHRGIMRNATKNPQVGNGTVCGGLVKIYLSK